MTKTMMMPFWYEQDVVLKRRQNVETIRLVDTVPVHIPELDDSSAPVVIRSFGLEGIAPYVMRRIDGRLYGPVDDLRVSGKANLAYADKQALRADIETLSKAVEVIVAGTHSVHWKNYPLPIIDSGSFSYAARPSANAADVRKVVRDGHEEARSEAEAAASTGFALVDGVLFVEEPEPRWVLGSIDCTPPGERHVNGVPRWAPSLSLRRPHDTPSHDRTMFRGDRLQDAIRFATAQRNPNAVQVMTVEIADDLVWTFDDEAALARRWGEEMVHWFEAHGDSVVLLEDDAFHAFMELRRLVREDRQALDVLAALQARFQDVVKSRNERDSVVSNLEYVGRTPLLWLETLGTASMSKDLEGIRL